MEIKTKKERKQITMVVPEDWHHRLKVSAAKEDTTMTEIVIRAVERDFIKDQHVGVSKAS